MARWGASRAFRSRRDPSPQLLGQDWSRALLFCQPEVAQVFWAGVVQGSSQSSRAPNRSLPGAPSQVAGPKAVGRQGYYLEALVRRSPSPDPLTPLSIVKGVTLHSLRGNVMSKWHDSECLHLS